jgi:drug/metabolite transporter (DMT)-like permease
MLRGGIIIFTCLFSRIFLKRAIHPHMIVGMLCCFSGFVIVGIASLMNKPSTNDDDSHSLSSTIPGVVMVLGSLIVDST